jgi:hypothetical protein
MARELVGRMVLGGVGKRLSEDWFWYSLLLKLLGECEEKVKNEKDQKSKPMGATAHRWITRIWNTMMIVWTGIFTLFAFYSAAPPAEQRYDGCLRPWLSLLQSFIGYDDARDGKPMLARLLVGTTDGIATLYPIPCSHLTNLSQSHRPDRTHPLPLRWLSRSNTT